MSGYGAFSEVYDLLMGNVDYKERAESFDTLIKKYSLIEPKTLLDIGCGTGNLTFLFYEKGYDITAVDISEDMLMQAFEKKMNMGANSVLLLCQDMTELDLNDTVDAAISSMDSINHLTDEEDVKKAFERIALFLNKGGVFIFDANTVYKHREVLGNNCFQIDAEDVFCSWQNNLYADNLVGISLNIFKKDFSGKYQRDSEYFEEKAYTKEQFIAFGKEAGLEFVAEKDENTLSEPKALAERLYYVFRKI